MPIIIIIIIIIIITTTIIIIIIIITIIIIIIITLEEVISANYLHLSPFVVVMATEICHDVSKYEKETPLKKQTKKNKKHENMTQQIFEEIEFHGNI